MRDLGTIGAGFTVKGAVEQVAAFLLISALVGMLARRLRVPYVVALVILGLAVAATHLITLPRLEPSLMLFVFLPHLLFDASFRLDVRELRVLVTRYPSWLAPAC